MTSILFELHHIGDAVLSVPFVRGMKNQDLHVVCRQGSVPIFRKFLEAERIHSWEPWWEVGGREKIASFIAIFSILGRLRALGARRAYCVWADSRVHLLMRLSRCHETFGFSVNRQNFYASERPWRWRRMKLGQLLGLICPLTHPLQRTSYEQSHLDDWSQLSAAVGTTNDSRIPWFEVQPHPGASALRDLGKKLWLIHPGGRLPTKRWPLARFQELLAKFLSDSSVILIEPPDSPGLSAVSEKHVSVSTQDIDELLEWIQSADEILCNDSLVSHLAAALGKPVWTIFGSGNPRWFAPFENFHRVIATDVCSYRPCIDRCVYASPICLDSITVAHVKSALLDAEIPIYKSS